MSTLPKWRVWDEAGHPCRGRYLVTERGEPFFYLGDTAWELFHRLTREEADLYLTDRAAKGFTVIQAVALAELDGLNTPNAYGDTPLHRNDPAQPNEAYFRHVDWVIDRANALGLYVGLLPTWGDKVNQSASSAPQASASSPRPQATRRIGCWCWSAHAPLSHAVGEGLGVRGITSARA